MRKHLHVFLTSILIVWQLKDGCSKCNDNPLFLTNVDFNEKCSSNRLAVVCEKCTTVGRKLYLGSMAEEIFQAA